MRARTSFRVCAAALAGLALATAGFADDANPSPFRFANPTSTVQEWDYSTAAVPLVADGNLWGTGGGGFVNPFGVPRHSIRANTAGWLPGHAGGGGGPRNGVCTLPAFDDALFHEVPNGADTFGRKAFWIQVTWVANAAVAAPAVEVQTGAGIFAASPGAQFLLPDGWVHTTYVLAIEPCPPGELVVVRNDRPGAQYFVDQVVIDTICEPDFRFLSPTHLAVQFGRVDSGTVASLAADDGNVLRVCRFVVPNTLVPPVQFEVEARNTPMGTLDALQMEVKSRMTSAGSFAQQLEMFDYSANAYRDSTLTSPFGTAFGVRQVDATPPVAGYLSPSKDLKGRLSVRKTGPSAVAIWCMEVEYWRWKASD